MSPSTPRRVAAGIAVAAITATALAGCGDDEPTWGAVDESTCAALDLAGAVARAFPDAGPSTIAATEPSLGSGAPSLVTCTAYVDAGTSGRIAVVAEISSSDTAGVNSLYALRDEGELSLAGARIEVEPEPVEGWWDDGVRVAATSEPAPPVAAVVHLTVRDDNLVVAVQVSDWRGSDLTDPEADDSLANAIVAAVPEVVDRR